jgi:RecB family exonuclease
LLGVIDRINKDEDEIVIIDYKTDNFESSDYDKKVTEYLHQMEFYAFISSIFFKTDKVKLILFFINHPDKPYIKKFSLEELKQIEKKFEELIQKIEKQKFEMNEYNCSICEYATNSKCVLVKNHL